MTTSDARHHLISALEADLVGPFDPKDPTEKLELAPSKWYLTGFLAPEGVEVATHDDDNLEANPEMDDDEAGGPEEDPKQKNFYPSSLGLSVLLPAGSTSDTVQVTLRFADYEYRKFQDVMGHAPSKEAHEPTKLWCRMPRGPFTVSIPLDHRKLLAGVDVTDARGVQIFGKLETINETRVAPAGTRALSLFVVNKRAPAEESPDEQFLFQVELELHSAMGFVPRPNRRGENLDDMDERVADLQFRDRNEWAVGHNVSIRECEPRTTPSGVHTTWLPTHEVRRVRTTERENVVRDMDKLANLASGGEAVRALMPMVDEYGAWLKEQAAKKADSAARGETRDELLKLAKRAQARIREGIELLAKDDDIFEAFRLANRAMAMSARRRSPADYATRVPTWRMFQLAFVLMNLPALADPTHVDRDAVDLIFFPTGGGKTEAYLGVIAVTLLLRRMRGASRPDGGLGVAVLLRYTLRLLTLDQLGRASTLVCALEMIRREAPTRLGASRFAIGLWVGRAATSNTLEQAAESVKAYKNSRGGSPCPLTECPWCKKEFAPDSFALRPTPTRPERIVVACLSRDCAFNVNESPDGLPLLFVDEQIYRELPAFLIATVDKFAMLPWRGETGMLFGRAQAFDGTRFFGPVDGHAPKTATPLSEGLLPPELIVQDELHLIAGPLGTMVGLFETAIEYLCLRTIGDKEVRPKILASTATVRRAQQQIEALFNRKRFALFPPQGIDDSETFFAEVDHTGPGRLYVGVAASGRALKAILLRTYVDLLAASQKLYDPRGDANQIADTYMTIVGYFNSLRELGGMRRLVEDDVRNRASHIDRRVPYGRHSPNPWMKRRDIKGEPVELTSREKTPKIAENKARIAKPHSDPEHVDVVLASNMISVGVDIDRLGLMVVAGQPKTTSEYIQASSRVGRKYPGLVVTCFNLRKPRDRSHYERFAAYHSCFYRYVEAQSLTPFSAPAIDRGLAGVLVAMTRLHDAAATASASAMRIGQFRTSANAAAAALGERAARQPNGDAAEQEERGAMVAKRAVNLLDAWEQIVQQKRTEAAAKVCYSALDKPHEGRALLISPLDDGEGIRTSDEEKFRAPMSMRDVEASVHLWLSRGELGDKR